LDIWVAQCARFLREVAGCGEPVAGHNSTVTRRAVVAGNSIGGLTALALAAAEPSLVRGVASLNCAGRFSPTPAERVQAQRRKRVGETPFPMNGFATAWSSSVDSVGAVLRRLLLGGAFVITKQPARISQVCRALPTHVPGCRCLGLRLEARAFNNRTANGRRRCDPPNTTTTRGRSTAPCAHALPARAAASFA
jgi:pimeloyl-ACP methyl ester carboxylesterase